MLGLDWIWIGLDRIGVDELEWMDRSGLDWIWHLHLDWIWHWMGFELGLDGMDLDWNGLDQAGNIFLFISPMDGNPQALLMKSNRHRWEYMNDLVCQV